MIRRVFSFARVGIAIALLAHLSACGGCSSPTGESDFFDPTGFGEYEFDGVPDIEAPDRLLFGEVGVGNTGTQTAAIRNVGRESLKISQWTVTDGFKLSFPAGREIDEIDPGDSVNVVVSYSALDDDERRGELVIESNDPDEPVVVIDLFVNAKFPCLETIPDDVVDFGEVDPDESVPRIVTVRNCSPNAETTFTIEGVRGSDAFAYSDGPALQTSHTLAVGEEVEVIVTFTPPEAGDYRGTLDFVSNDEFRPEHQLDLRGLGAQGQCPSAVIAGRADVSGSEFVANPTTTFQTIPLDRLSLRSESIAYDEKSIDRWSWSLVRRPQDSAARFTNGPEAMEQELFLDLAGEYIIELEVWDNEGVQSCRAARMTVQAIADEDIHVQLVWDTPNDPNQNDASGSDVDLHLLHPNGQWNRSPWDCFWQNLIPDWASPRDAGVDSFDCERNPDREGCHDDPSLDIDDVDGWGPENINLNNPELNRTYSVGVHYFSDHGYGMSLATVRIFIGGVMRAEYPRQRIFDQEFWHVADVDWPTGDVNPRGQVYDSFP